MNFRQMTCKLHGSYTVRLRLLILVFGVFLLVNLGHAARANADGLVFWDQSIAMAVSDSVAVDEACRPSPYARFRQTCVNNSLNISLERSPFEKLTFLDHIALFVHKHRNVGTTQQIMQGIRFKIGVNLSNVYQQEAKVEARLRIRW
jgi:hypothetical protein